MKSKTYRLNDNAGFFAGNLMRDAILRAACSRNLLRVPEGWNRRVNVAQPVKKVCSLAPMHSADAR